jgi:hypothetical protein
MTYSLKNAELGLEKGEPERDFFNFFSPPDVTSGETKRDFYFPLWKSVTIEGFIVVAKFTLQLSYL